MIYSVQIEDLEADSNFGVEYESNLEVYFYKKVVAYIVVILKMN